MLQKGSISNECSTNIYVPNKCFKDIWRVNLQKQINKLKSIFS